MEPDQLPLSKDVLAVMRGAVTYAVATDSEFVTPPHLLLALLDDAEVGDVLADYLERGKIVSETKKKRPPGVLQMPEGPLPADETPPFKRYDTLAFRSADGETSRWLDRESFKVFIEGARRIDDGPYQPKHLAAGYMAESIKDRDLQVLLGRDPRAVSMAIFELVAPPPPPEPVIE
jgi:hypothetical protein